MPHVEQPRERGESEALAHDGFRVTRGHCQPKAAYVANETRIDTQDALECTFR